MANKPGRPVIPNRQGLYAKIANHATAAIDVLVELLHSPNDNIRLGAARTLLDKCLPDMKSLSVSGSEDNEPLEIKFVEIENDQINPNN